MTWSTFLVDLRRAWRGIARSPGLTALAVGMLGLGIGGATAIFSVVDSILIEPLPFQDPSRLVFVWSDMANAGYPRGPLSGPELQDLRERTTRFDGFAAAWATTTTVTGDGPPEMLRIGMVTPDLYPLLGVRPALGRLLGVEDEGAILLSGNLWRRRYGGDPGIIGRRLTINGQPSTVVGVMPAGFKLFLPLDAGVPDDLEAWQLFNRNVVNGERGRMFLRVVGRLRGDASLEAAQDEVSQLAGKLSREHTEYGGAGRRFALVGLKEDGVRPLQGTLLALAAGVLLVLLTTIINVAGLVIARSAARAHTTALSLALGASRARIFSQCLAEGTLLAGLGAVAGVATAFSGIRLLLAFRPESLTRIDHAAANPVVLGLVTAVAAVVFALAPIGEVGNSEMATVLRGRAPGSAGTVRPRIRTILVAAQLALAVVLVVTAALFGRSYRAIQAVDPGFRAAGVMSFRIALSPDRAFDQDASNSFSRQLAAKLGALPGVAAVGAISHLPFDNVPNWSTTWLVEAGGDDSEARRADARAITPGYLSVIRARLVAGRDFTEADDPRGPLVVIVDESFARRAWPNVSPLGQTVALDPFVTGHATLPATVVGVVGHIRHLSLLDEVREQVYFPARWIPRNPMAYVIRTASDATGLAATLRAAVDELDPAVPIVDLRSLDAALVGARGTQRFTLQLVTLFAVLGLLIAAIGIYGLLAYLVAKRRAEFGVRMALGASPRAVIGLVLRDTARLAGPGLLVGVGLALLVTAALRHQLYGVGPTDLVSYLVVVPVLGLTALLASWVPARRATRTSPSDALRAD